MGFRLLIDFAEVGKAVPWQLERLEIEPLDGQLGGSPLPGRFGAKEFDPIHPWHSPQKLGQCGACINQYMVTVPSIFILV